MITLYFLDFLTPSVCLCSHICLRIRKEELGINKFASPALLTSQSGTAYDSESYSGNRATETVGMNRSQSFSGLSSRGRLGGRVGEEKGRIGGMTDWDRDNDMGISSVLRDEAALSTPSVLNYEQRDGYEQRVQQYGSPGRRDTERKAQPRQESNSSSGDAFDSSIFGVVESKPDDSMSSVQLTSGGSGDGYNPNANAGRSIDRDKRCSLSSNVSPYPSLDNREPLEEERGDRPTVNVPTVGKVCISTLLLCSTSCLQLKYKQM